MVKVVNWWSRLDQTHKKITKIVAWIATLIIIGGWVIDLTVATKKHFDSQAQYRHEQELKNQADSMFKATVLERFNDLERKTVIIQATSTFLLGKAGGCYWRADSIGRTIENGAELTSLTGYTNDEMLGFNWQTHVYPPDLPEVEKNIKRTIEAKTDWFASFRFVLKNGQIVKLDSEARRILNKGRIVEYVGMIKPSKNQ